MDIFYKLHSYIFNRLIAKWVVKQGIKLQVSGKCTIPFKHASNHFHLNYGYIMAYQYKIADLIDMDVHIKQKTTIHNECFIVFFTE